jgi:hypothetical protein
MTRPLRPLDGAAALQWRVVPRAIGRVFPGLAGVAAEGAYLAGVPRLGAVGAILAFALGLFAGLVLRGDDPVYTSALPVLGLLVSISLVSGQFGLLAFLAFVGVEALRFWLGDFGNLKPGYMAAIGVSWLFLAQLALTAPYAARRLVRLPGRFALADGLLAALLAAGFVELWTRLAMVALRPMFLWRGIDVPMRLVGFGDQEAQFLGLTLHVLAWLALAVGLGRWIVQLVFTWLRPVADAGYVPPPSRAPWPLQVLLRAAVFTLALAGLFTTIAGGVVFALSVAGVLTARRIASSDLRVARLDRLVVRIPAALRLVLTYALAVGLAQVCVLLLRDVFGWRTMTTAAASIVLVLAATLILWPQVQPGETAPRPPGWLRRILSGGSKVAPAAAAVATLGTATSAFAHHCSFQPGCECLTSEGALAALIAAALMGLMNADPNAKAEPEPEPEEAVDAPADTPPPTGADDAPSPAWGEQPMDAAVAEHHIREQLAADVAASEARLNALLDTRDGYMKGLGDLRERMAELRGRYGFAEAADRFWQWNREQPVLIPDPEWADDKKDRLVFRPDTGVLTERLVESYRAGLTYLFEETKLDDKIAVVSQFENLRTQIQGVDALIDNEFKNRTSLQGQIDALNRPPAKADTPPPHNAFEDPD